MASERLNIRILINFRWYIALGGRGTDWVTDTVFKEFAVYFPTDAGWKERAELVRSQIVAKVGSDHFKILNGSFIAAPRIPYESTEEFSRKFNIAMKMQKLLLWEDGKTPTEERWLKMNRPAEPLVVKSYTTNGGGM